MLIRRFFGVKYYGDPLRFRKLTQVIPGRYLLHRLIPLSLQGAKLRAISCVS